MISNSKQIGKVPQTRRMCGTLFEVIELRVVLEVEHQIPSAVEYKPVERTLSCDIRNFSSSPSGLRPHFSSLLPRNTLHIRISIVNQKKLDQWDRCVGFEVVLTNGKLEVGGSVKCFQTGTPMKGQNLCLEFFRSLLPTQFKKEMGGKYSELE